MSKKVPPTNSKPTSKQAITSNTNNTTPTAAKGNGMQKSAPKGGSGIIPAMSANDNYDNYGSEPTNYSHGMGGNFDDPLSNIGLPSSSSESVRVAVRIRPMNNMEISRGDEYCMKFLDERSCQLFQKGNIKHYTFNGVLQESCSQPEVFVNLKVGDIINSALEGYSATIFAYGQTGSGKTYTMAGVEEKLGREVYISDETEGIIPRAIRYLWQEMAQRSEQYFVKASYTEIYNEQLRDLLNPSSGILHCRWNVKNGFFVEDLMIVECTSVNDMVAVLHEGMKNRKIGSHELNKDSSRSHTILTVYVISEVKTEGSKLKKYGKISFVDLAGSERLKESKSQGEMIKETGNINKSLFTLGKVIAGLTDKRNKQPYIPYRDSKLTMLLMDSLGGNSKALMIACISPSNVYFDETLSTLSYASRTMNIKNKPTLQMDQKDQVIYNLNNEIEALKLENQYLKDQLTRAANGMPLEIRPEFFPTNKPKGLPPLSKQSSSSRPISNDIKGSQMEMRGSQMGQEVPVNKVIAEYQAEIDRLKKENEELQNARELAEKNYQYLTNDNSNLTLKLENLENVFLSSNPGKQKLGDDYMASGLMMENSELKKKLLSLEEKNLGMMKSLKQAESAVGPNNPAKLNEINEVLQMRQDNNQLQQRVEFLQKRERELMDNIAKIQKMKKLK